jgi:co-chaperonin GroES (HSP10)
MIQPLRDNLCAIPIEATDRVGALFMPANAKQALRTHYQSKVLGAGPDAVNLCPVGSIIHTTESWGEEIEVRGKKAKLGRLRDINGVVKDGALQPVGDRVLCREIPKDDEKEGVFIPEVSGKLDVKAEVVAVGDKVTDIHPGDHVFLARYVFAKIRIGEQEMVLVNESNITGVMQHG